MEYIAKLARWIKLEIKMLNEAQTPKEQIFLVRELTRDSLKLAREVIKNEKINKNAIKRVA